MKLKNIMLITGASRGIGAETAKLAATHGYYVVVNYINNVEKAEAVVNHIKQQGGEAMAIQADVGDEAQVVSMFAEVKEKVGPISKLINNAGTLELQSPVENMSLERWHKTFSSNVFGTFLCCREGIKHMKQSKASDNAIVNVSSAASRLGAANEYVDYAASKGAVDSLTIGLSKELAPNNIRVNGVRPAFIDTDIHASGGEPDRLQRVKPLIPLGREGQAKEVAESILWLASSKSSYVTGTLLDVAGGR